MLAWVQPQTRHDLLMSRRLLQHSLAIAIQVFPRLMVARIKSQGLGVVSRGLVELALAGEDDSEVGVCIGSLGVEPQRLGIMDRCFGELPLTREVDSQVVVRTGEARLEP